MSNGLWNVDINQSIDLAIRAKKRSNRVNCSKPFLGE